MQVVDLTNVTGINSILVMVHNCHYIFRLQIILFWWNQVTFTNGAIVPSTDNDIDLGSSSRI